MIFSLSGLKQISFNKLVNFDNFSFSKFLTLFSWLKTLLELIEYIILSYIYWLSTDFKEEETSLFFDKLFLFNNSLPFNIIKVIVDIILFVSVLIRYKIKQKWDEEYIWYLEFSSLLKIDGSLTSLVMLLYY